MLSRTVVNTVKRELVRQKPVVGNTVLGNAQFTAKFHKTAVAQAASVFKMPAMSPTMTEGGITSWKFKAGDEFLAGDVLLEVETDKATIDVEAQDDGIFFEMLVNEGESGIPVGKPIAFLAEPGDDLSTLEKPSIEEEPKPEPEPEQKTESEQKPPASSPKPSDSKPAPAGIFSKADPNQFLFPSVELLLHENHISKEEALEKIEASGPKGRLTKGDVLAYLGQIEKSAVSKVAEYINNKQHLDLSNIVLADPSSAPAKSEKEPKQQAPEPIKPQNILTIQLSTELEDQVNKDAFKYAFENSVHNAIKRTYAHRFPEYSNSPVGSSMLTNDIFDDLLAPSVNVSRFTVYDITYKFRAVNSSPSYQSFDDFDDLLSVSKPQTSTVSEDTTTVDVEFKVKYNDKLLDSKQFVDYFQDSLLTQVPSKQLVVFN